MVVMVIYSAWTYPFEVAFLKSSAQTHKQLYIADSIVDFFFAVDIVLTFIVAYVDPVTHLLVRDPKSIATRYLSIALQFSIHFVLIRFVYWGK